MRFDAFAGLMTGNTVLLGIALSSADPWRGLHYGAIILAFFVGVLVSRTLLRFHLAPWVALTLAAAALVVCAFYETPWSHHPGLCHGHAECGRDPIGSVTLNTVFITGNTAEIGEGIVGLLWPGQGKHAEPPPGDVAIFGMVWVSYAVGAVLGAAANAMLTRPLLAPAVILPFVLLRRRQAVSLNDVRKRPDFAGPVPHNPSP